MAAADFEAFISKPDNIVTAPNDNELGPISSAHGHEREKIVRPSEAKDIASSSDE